MALTFDEAYQLLQANAKAIGILYKRGDKMARDVIERYRDWYHHEYASYLGAIKVGQYLPDSRRRRAVVSALEQYLQRDMTIHERAELAGKKGHLVEDDAAIPDNLVHLSVHRALRSRN